MAIKGKKKQQSRGSQARRRPAAAPRPALTASPRKSGRLSSPAAKVAGALVLLIVLSGLATVVTGILDRADEAEARREALADYSGEIRSLLQDLTGPAGAMAGAPATADEGLGRLAKDARRWQQAFVEAQGRAAGIVAPRGAQAPHNAFQQSLRLYGSAAATYGLAPDAGKVTEEILQRAADQRDQAGALWQSGIDALDAVRADEGMSPSGLRSPAQSSTTPGLQSPPQLPGIEPGDLPGGDEDGAAGNRGGGGRRGKGSRSDDS